MGVENLNICLSRNVLITSWKHTFRKNKNIYVRANAKQTHRFIREDQPCEEKTITPLNLWPTSPRSALFDLLSRPSWVPPVTSVLRSSFSGAISGVCLLHYDRMLKPGACHFVFALLTELLHGHLRRVSKWRPSRAALPSPARSLWWTEFCHWPVLELWPHAAACDCPDVMVHSTRTILSSFIHPLYNLWVFFLWCTKEDILSLWFLVPMLFFCVSERIYIFGCTSSLTNVDFIEIKVTVNQKPLFKDDFWSHYLI